VARPPDEAWDGWAYFESCHKEGLRMKPNIGLSADETQKMIGVLNALLSDEYVLYTRTRNYHWNVFGPQFNDLHKLFESQYEELEAMADEIAERARALGGPALGTLVEFIHHTRLKEFPGQYPSAGQMIANLLVDHEAVIRQLRADVEAYGERYRDVVTGDLLIGFMRRHEKMAWMLRACLEGKG
jgi:starvation-inducible DNA-binding protein